MFQAVLCVSFFILQVISGIKKPNFQIQQKRIQLFSAFYALSLHFDMNIAKVMENTISIEAFDIKYSRCRTWLYKILW